ncbi:MAG: hypothetical protein GX431_06245 [Bacteroidales bacterium]|nr:hypothetical protein [Bacteroidales bacterium]
MEQIVQIQEEFEKLISQLEKLKKVSDITSENISAAKAVIKSVDEFILCSRTFEEKLIEDSNTRSKTIETLTGNLENSLIKLDEKTNGLSKGFENEFQSFKELIAKLIETNSKIFKEEVTSTFKNFENINSKIATDINEITKKNIGLEIEIKRVYNKLSDIQIEHYRSTKVLRNLLIGALILVMGLGGILIILLQSR